MRLQVAIANVPLPVVARRQPASAPSPSHINLGADPSMLHTKPPNARPRQLLRDTHRTSTGARPTRQYQERRWLPDGHWQVLGFRPDLRLPVVECMASATRCDPVAAPPLLRQSDSPSRSGGGPDVSPRALNLPVSRCRTGHYCPRTQPLPRRERAPFGIARSTCPDTARLSVIVTALRGHQPCYRQPPYVIIRVAGQCLVTPRTCRFG